MSFISEPCVTFEFKIQLWVTFVNDLFPKYAALNWMVEQFTRKDNFSMDMELPACINIDNNLAKGGALAFTIICI